MSKNKKHEEEVQTSEVTQEEISAEQEQATAAQETDSSEQESTETLSAEQVRIANLEADLEQVKSALEEEKTTYLRKAADMENYRKRLIREKEMAVQYANERLLNDLIPILDDFDRAIEASAQVEGEGHAEGVKMIRQQMLDMLEKNWGLKVMSDIVGTEFSPHEHEALMMESRDDIEVETVLAELQKGYYLHSKVLRHAKVKVGKPE